MLPYDCGSSLCPTLSRVNGKQVRLVRLSAVRVLVVTHYYSPEIGAPQTRLRETAQMLTALGHQVSILTNHPHYPDGRTKAPYRALSVLREEIDGLRVTRLPVFALANQGFIPRVVDQASFAFVAAAAVGEARLADVLLVESPPLFLGATGRWLSHVSRRPYVLHVADPWPAYPIELGVLRSRAMIRLARALEAFAYFGASRITTPTNGCARLIEEQTTARGKVRVVPNGVDLNRFDPLADVREARGELNWDLDPFTFVYAGTVGLAQGLGTLINAAAIMKSLSDRPPLVRIVGGGPEVAAISRRATELGLLDVRFHAPVAQHRVPVLLAAADAILVMLKRGKLARAAMPTKLVEGLAAGRPIVVSADGDAAETVNTSRAGLVAPAEDAPTLADRMLELASSPSRAVELGANGRLIATASFDRKAVVHRLAGELQAAVSLGRRP